MRRTASIATIVGLGMALGAPFVLGGTDVLSNLQAVSSKVIFGLVGLATLSAIAKAAKLQLLLNRLSQQPIFLRTFAISLATDFAFLASPAGAAGYAVNIALLRRAGSSWSVATTVVGADQALDLMFFAFAVPTSALFALGPLASVLPAVPALAYAYVFFMFALVTCILWHCRRSVGRVLKKWAQATPWLGAKEARFEHFIKELGAHMRTLLHGDRKQSAGLLLLTALQWLTRYGTLWFVLAESGHVLSFGFVLVLQAVVLHLAQWTGIPAGGGGADFGLAIALAPWVSKSLMATVLLLWRFGTLYYPLIIGAFSLVALAGAWSVHTHSDTRKASL